MISASGSMSRWRGLRRAGEQADISTFTAQLSDPVLLAALQLHQQPCLHRYW